MASIALPLIVSIRFQVLFHSGHPGSFHLSLTVLLHYRSPKVFSLGGWSPLLPTGLACPVVLKLLTGALHLSGTRLSLCAVGLSSALPLDVGFLLLGIGVAIPASASYPAIATPTRFCTMPVWASPLSLATTRGILSLPGGTKMFQFPPFPP